MSDEHIMEAVKNGDLQQASVLFERYQLRLFNFLARLTTDRELAEDLTQNTFLRMLKYRHSYREGARFQSWIYQVARNVFADHYQAQKNKRAGFLNVENMSDALADENDSETMDEQEKILARSMALLTEEQRELLVLTRFEHMKYEEVAELMNTTVANIKVKVHRAIGKLREHYFQLEQL